MEAATAYEGPLDCEQRFAGLPLGRAKTAGLQRRKNAQRFVDAAADAVGGHDGVLEHAFRIDDEQPALCRAGRFVEHAVRARGLFGEVGDERIRGARNAVLFTRRVEPCKVTEDGVGRATEDLRIELFELVDAIGERGDFGRTHKREIERIEEQYQPLAAVIRELDLFTEGLGARRVLGAREPEIGRRPAYLSQHQLKTYFFLKVRIAEFTASNSTRPKQ